MPRWPSRRRRPSMRPENVRRRLNNRVVNVIAALVIASGYWVWDTCFARDGNAAAPAPQTVAAGSPNAAHRAAINAADEGTDIDALVAARRSNAQVIFSGTVLKTLPDDNNGSRHQRFLVTTPAGNRVLVAHNIDLAPRIGSLAAGDSVRLHGEFEWNEKGGVVHWTHHDPDGRHPGGWIEHEGRRFQ